MDFIATRTMKVVVTTGAIRRAKPQSSRHHRQIKASTTRQKLLLTYCDNADWTPQKVHLLQLSVQQSDTQVHLENGR